MNTKRMNENMNTLLGSKTLRTLCLIVLLWASLASAFTSELISACLEVSEKGLEASPQSLALVLKNNEKLNLMGLVGEEGGGISKQVYQANQIMYARVNQIVCRRVMSDMGLEGTLPPIKFDYEPGTDTDLNLKFEDGRQIRVKDMQNVRFAYNDKYPEVVKELTGEQLPTGKNYCEMNQTDPMPDASRDPKTGKMINIDEAEFGRTAKYTNQAGGLMYENPKAVEVELNINKPGYKVSLDKGNAYAQEMVENLDKKINKMEYHQVKQTEFESYHKKAVDPEVRAKLDLEIKETKANVQLDQSMAGKYMKRMENLDKKLRKQGNLFAKDHPHTLSKIDSDATRELSDLSDRISKFKRGPDTADLAAEIGVKQLKLKEYYVNNLSKTYAELATTTKDPKLAKQYMKSAVDMADKNLGTKGHQTLIDNVTKIYGKDAPIVKQLDQEISRVVSAQKRQKFSDDMVPVAMGVMGAADFINDALDMQDTYEKGGLQAVIMQQGVKAVTGKVIGSVTSRFIAAVPAAGPVATLAGVYMVSNEATRNVMKRVTIGGKTLDVHTQEGIDNAFFVSGADKQMRDANLTKRLVKLLENEKYSLPEGMTIQQAQKQLLYNADQGGPLFDFLEGAPERPEKVVKEKTWRDISLDDIEGKTPEEIEQDQKLTEDLIRLIKGGKFALPEGITLPEARKLALLNARAGKPRFGFLIDKAKQREAQMAALEKWKNAISPVLPYQFISFRDPSWERIREGLVFKATAIWSVEKRTTWPEGNLSLYRDGDQIAQVGTAGIRNRGKYEQDPMNEKKWLLSVPVKIIEPLAGPYECLLPPETYHYSILWHLVDAQGQPKSVLGSTEQSVTYAVFPRENSKPRILLCKADGQPLNDDDGSKRLVAHLGAHFHALNVNMQPSRSRPDVDVYQVELPARLYSGYNPNTATGGYTITFYSEDTRLGSRTFDAEGKLTAQNLNRRGLVYVTSRYVRDGVTKPEIYETWYDQDQRKHGPERVLIDGKAKLDEFYKHGKKHGRQVRADTEGRAYAVETYRDGKRHGLHETFHSDSGTPTGVTRLKTSFQDDVEVGPHEEFYADGGKKLYEEYDIQDGDPVKHGRKQVWNEQGKLLSDEQYASGEFHGKCMYYTENGDVSRETNYSEGLKQGEERTYHENSNLSSVVSYNADKAEGVGVFYHESGRKKLEALYINGRRIGDLKRWNSHQRPADWTGSNDLVYEARYDDEGCILFLSEIKGYYGESGGRWEYNYVPKGGREFSSSVSSADGKSVKHGLERCTLGGQMVLERHWNMGLQDGQFRRWTQTGLIQVLEEYKAGQRQGKRQKWDGHGNVILSETYEDELLTGERIELGKNSYAKPRFETTRHEIQNGKSVSVPGWRIRQEVKLVDGKYVPHGETEHKVNGKVVSVKNYQNGQEAGKGVQARADGTVETKRVIDGKLDGAYELRGPDGKIIKKGYYQMGEPTKEEEYGQTENGLFYRESAYDIVDGKAVERTRRYHEYQGELHHYHGMKEYHRKGHLIERRMYQDNVQHGPFSLFYDTGEPKKTGICVEGKLHGPALEYDRQGNIKREVEYEHGQMIHEKTQSRAEEGLYTGERHWVIVEGQTRSHGPQTRHLDDQMISVETYDKGVRHGDFGTWTNNGQLKARSVYDRGVQVSSIVISGPEDRVERTEANWINQDGKRIKHGVQRRHINDQIVTEENYSQGQKTGTWRRWSETGVPLILESYDDQSRKHGPWKKWTDAGVLVSQATYLQDQYHGPYVSNSEKGTPRKAIDYEFGKKRKEVSYDYRTKNPSRITLYDADEHKIKEAIYSDRDGVVHKTLIDYIVIDNESVYHGTIQRFAGSRLESSDTYDRGVRTASFYCSVREGKRTMTWSQYRVQGDQSVRHGVVKQYCEGGLQSEETYDQGQLTQRISYSEHKGVAFKSITPMARFDDRDLSHGVGKLYRDGVFSQESHYEKGDLVKIVSFGKRDGKTLKTVYPYVQNGGKSLKHGIAKRYLDDKLIEEIEYRDGEKVE